MKQINAPILATRADAHPDPVVPPRPKSGTRSTTAAARAPWATSPPRRHHAHAIAMVRTAAFTAALSAAAATCPAQAQVARNGPEWGGKDHQPTQAEVVGREDRAGVEPSPTQAGQDKRTVQQLDQQLLHEEAVDPPRASDPGPIADPSGKP